MADKEIIINGKTMLHGNGVKDGVETSTSTTVCFDEVVPQGSPNTSYTLEIDRLVYETKEDYDWLREELEKLKSVPGMITTREIIRFKDSEPFVIIKNFTDCILDGKDYEMKPEEQSAQSLKFICGGCDERTEYV
jgi:hypothetical protein